MDLQPLKQLQQPQQQQPLWKTTCAAKQNVFTERLDLAWRQTLAFALTI
jgi:hypothetical protein